METIKKEVSLPRYELKTSVFFDTHLSQGYFEDFTSNAGGDCEVLTLTGRHGVDFIVCGEDLEKPHFKKSHLAKMSKAKLLELADFIFNHSNWYDYSEHTRAELIDEIKSITVADYYKAHYEQTHWHDLERDFIVRGYSQGDAVAVKLIDAPKWVNKDYLTHLFYDSPLFCRVTIIDNLTNKEIELYLDENLEDLYNYDEDELQTIFANMLEKEDISSENKEALKALFADGLPIYPDYK